MPVWPTGVLCTCGRRVQLHWQYCMGCGRWINWDHEASSAGTALCTCGTVRCPVLIARLSTRLARKLKLTPAEMIVTYPDNDWKVHNHGPDEGRGTGCREFSLNGRLVGACRIIEAGELESIP